ncbi:MAG: GNAT family N-acetyltransferase [Anaerolineales bacterium]
MLNIEKVDTENKKQVKRFVELPFRIYADCPQWVPPLNVDAYNQLNRKKHPFHEHSDVDFFLAIRDGRDVGRIAVIENKPFNKYHNEKTADFYLFECEDDLEAATTLFNTAFDWAKTRGLNKMIGPKGMGPLDGYGVLVFGYEQRQTMTMLNYNHAYYQSLVEAQGFVKEVDFVSCYLPADKFQIPERVKRITERVMQRGHLEIKTFKNKKELLSWADRIGTAYNNAFVNNWEYYPLTQREIDFVVENIMTIADHRLIKIVTHDEDVVGFLFAFHDVSAAMQRAKGKLFPFGLLDILMEIRRTNTVAVNGMGILPEFQGHGGNALLYHAMGETLLNFGQFAHVEMTQVAETTEQMRADLKNLNGVEYKNHRVYQKRLE